MAKVFRDGGEFGDMLFWSTFTGWTNSSSQKRSGNYSYANPTGTNTTSKNISSVSEGYMSYATYHTSVFSLDTRVMLRNSTTPHVELYFGAGNKLYINAGGAGGVASSINSFTPTGIWHGIQVYANIDDSPNGIVIVKVNGLIEINFTGDVKNGATTTIDNISIISNTGANTVFFDDLAFNDTTGTEDNSWCGDVHIEYLPAVEDGDTLEFVQSSGSTHYGVVDDVPPNSDTDYVYASGSSTGVRDMYHVADFNPSGKNIIGIWAEMRAKDNAATSGSVKIGFKTGGNVYLSGSMALASNYSQYLGTSASLNPSTGIAWTDSDLDGVQFVIENG